MRYPGGKFRVGRKISDYLSYCRKKGQPYYEPFLGMASVLSKMENPRFGSDIDCGIINMWKWGLGGWKPPTNISRDEYEAARGLPDGHPLKTFIGTQCAFGGKYFGTYAVGKVRGKNYNFAEIGSKTLMQTSIKMSGTILECKPYWKVNPEGAIMYLDPPYPERSSVHKNSAMNYGMFYIWASLMAVKNDVYVSGYSDTPYPANFKICASFSSRAGMEAAKTEDIIECLFKVGPMKKGQLTVEKR